MGKRDRPYTSSFSSKSWGKRRRKWGYDDDDDGDSVYSYSFYFSPPSRLEVKVKPFQGKPVVNLAKKDQFISLSKSEFYDMIPLLSKLDEKVTLCQEKIDAHMRKKRQRIQSGGIDFEQVQPSERSKKEAEEDESRAANSSRVSGDEESDG